MSAFLGGPTAFRMAALWEVRGNRVSTLAWLGGTERERPTPAMATSMAIGALSANSYDVTAMLRGAERSLAYADAVRAGHVDYVVFAERVLATDRRSRLASTSSAFSEFRYAIYLGAESSPEDLLATDFPGGIPAGGTAEVTIPFGQTSLTLVAAATVPLAGEESARLPWILGIVGVALSVLAALFAQRGVNRRRGAEHDANEIAILNHELSDLYAEQRTIAVTLQRSLLPVRVPEVPGIELAVRYLPGAKGLDIGGDWYSVVAIDEGRFALVVGDVSGRGVRAAAVMAALRFTIRTLLLEGNAPPDALRKCAAHIRDLAYGHLATVVVAIGEVAAQRLTISSAGHLRPLLVADGVVSYLDIAVGVPLGVPLGVSGASYSSTTVDVPKGATLLFFTDGLVERRGENLDVGLARLASVAAAAPEDLEDFITKVCEELTAETDDDDVAMLALRWTLPA